MVRWLTGLWSKLAFTDRPISTQFLVVAGVVLCVTMAVLGTWVNEQIKHSVLVTSGAQATNFMTGFLEPRVQDLLGDGTLPQARQRELDELFIDTPLGNTVVSIKIWREDGVVIYSTTKDLIGQRFASNDVTKAAAGEIVAEYEDLVSQESAYEQTLDMALIEVYAPLYRTGTSQVLAVGEIYENANALAAELSQSRMITWVVVALTTIFMLAVLYLIVRRGAATIARQRSEANRLAWQNAELRVVADRSRLLASEANEQYLGRIGSDIHDGPIQLLTLGMLRLTTVVRSLTNRKKSGPPPVEQIESAITITEEALGELRNISTGLSLPEVGQSSLEEAIRLAVFRHEDLTGEKVQYKQSALPASVNEALKLCVYRIVQEGLTNATKHAPGAPKQVSVSTVDGQLLVEVADQGPGMAASETDSEGRPRLGLAGMRNRVVALKGTVEVISEPNRGTRVTARLPLEDMPVDR